MRGRLLNVPLPGSGHRFGAIVLHDGASTGWRWDGERKVNVFNELQRLETSAFITHAAFVHCEHSEDMQALLEARRLDAKRPPAMACRTGTMRTS